MVITLAHQSLVLAKLNAVFPAITLDFHQDSLLPGSKYHQRAKWCLEKNPDLTFDWIISWEPDGLQLRSLLFLLLISSFL